MRPAAGDGEDVPARSAWMPAQWRTAASVTPWSGSPYMTSRHAASHDGQAGTGSLGLDSITERRDGPTACTSVPELPVQLPTQRPAR